MKDLNDDRIQQLIQEGKLDEVKMEGQQEGKFYKTVFDALDQPLNNTLSSGLSDRVIQTIEAKKVKSSWTHLIPIISISAIFFLFMLVALMIVGTNFQFLSSLSSVKWYVLTGVFMIIFIQLVDKKLIRAQL